VTVVSDPDPQSDRYESTQAEPRSIWIALALVAILFGIGQGPFLGEVAPRLLSSILLTLALVGGIRFTGKGWVALILFGLALAWFASTPLLFSLLAFSGLTLLRSRGFAEHASPAYGTIVVGLACVAMYHLLLFAMPGLFFPIASATVRLTHSAAHLFDMHTQIGPTYFGLPALLLTLPMLLGSFRLDGAALRSFATRLVVVIIVWLAGAIILHIVIFRVLANREYLWSLIPNLGAPWITLGWFATSVPFILTIFAFGMTVIWKSARRALPIKKAPLQRVRDSADPSPVGWRGFVLAAIGIALSCSVTLRTLNSGERDNRVWIVTSGFMDFSVPEWGRYGLAQSGMFGLLEELLTRSGYKVSRIEHLRDLDAIESRGGVALVINPTDVNEDDVRAMNSHLEAGGGVLVLGDHTDIFGTMPHLNALLADRGMTFRFDSAFPVVAGWKAKYQAAIHPVTNGLDRRNALLQHGTGASLATTSTGWNPLILATHTFSDIGDYSKEDDSFLGDYRWFGNEQLGDLCIVAEHGSGPGRLVVFGDTSQFQSVSIIHSWPFILSVFDHVATPRLLNGRVADLAGITLLLAGIIFVFKSRQAALHSAIFAVAAASSLMLVTHFDDSHVNAGRISGPKAIIDTRHAPNVTLDHWRAASIDGLCATVFRTGRWPIVLRPGDQLHDDPDTNALLVIAPRRDPGADVVRYAKNLLDRGGVVLISVDARRPNGMARFAEQFGFGSDPVPFGPVPIRGKLSTYEFGKAMLEPQFSEAFPLTHSETPWDAVYVYAGRPIVLERKINQGRMVVIGDPEFFWDRTIEAEKDGWPGNLFLIRDMLNGQTEGPPAPPQFARTNTEVRQPVTVPVEGTP